METATGRDIPAPALDEVLPVIREFIVRTPDTCGGKPRIAGTRIQIKHVALMHERQGMTAGEILAEFPHLTLAGIYAALSYYHDHRDEVDGEILSESVLYERMKAMQPSLIQQKLDV
jgi:uncharacterized protein (DUF433 family)